METNYVKHLRNQLSFIHSSCNSFDNGFFEESIRLSVCIRVLFHNTNKSTSLFKHLGKENIKILSSCGENRN
ncbi:MAG: hypothetical protein ACTSYF_03655 [Promethearchaeota archaeon]